MIRSVNGYRLRRVGRDPLGCADSESASRLPGLLYPGLLRSDPYPLSRWAFNFTA